MVQAGRWIVSYLLYLLDTTAQIVYDTLPAVLPAERRYQPVLEIAIPVALAGRDDRRTARPRCWSPAHWRRARSSSPPPSTW